MAGTRGLVREIDAAREESLFVAFFAGTTLSSEGAWLRPIDVTPA